MRSCLMTAAVMALLVGHCASKVARTTLQELTGNADLIVIGKVTRVIEVEGIQVAQVQVSNTLKGVFLPTVYYLAQPTWICDITSATVGEEALFFFDEYEFDPRPGSMAYARPTGQAGTYTVQNGPIPITIGLFKEPPGFRERINAMVGSAPFWLLSWSGRGKMPIRNVHGKQYATLWTADVRLPATISTISGPERKYSAFIRSAPLSQVLDFVRRSSVRKRN